VVADAFSGCEKMLGRGDWPRKRGCEQKNRGNYKEHGEREKKKLSPVYPYVRGAAN